MEIQTYQTKLSQYVVSEAASPVSRMGNGRGFSVRALERVLGRDTLYITKLCPSPPIFCDISRSSVKSKSINVSSQFIFENTDTSRGFDFDRE